MGYGIKKKFLTYRNCFRDNVPESVIIEALDSVTSDTLQAACNSLALMARRLSHDEVEISSNYFSFFYFKKIIKKIS